MNDSHHHGKLDEDMKADFGKVEINSQRLRSFWEEVNTFGLNAETGGINRCGYTSADTEARSWLVKKLESDGFAVTVDGVNNVIGRIGPKEGPTIMCGSHLDSVPEGGKYDGVLGVCAAIECARVIQENGMVMTKALEVIAFAEEEGRFGGMLGSQALTGQVDSSWVSSAQDAFGVSLLDAMSSQGSTNVIEKLPICSRAEDTNRPITDFVELHIEQGPVLEIEKLPIGIVTSITGCANNSWVLRGKENHAGTTPMYMRSDALVAFSEICASINGIIAQYGCSENTRMTIGKIDVSPNFPHTVPGKVEFSLITRDEDESRMRNLIKVFNESVESICQKHSVQNEMNTITSSFLTPVTLDAKNIGQLCKEAEKAHMRYRKMPSGAGHDTQMMQSICPSCMIFIPSKEGVSHSPTEFTTWEDVLTGCQLLLNFLVTKCTEKL